MRKVREKRKEERISATLSAIVQGAAGKVRNVSASGLFLEVEKSYRVGSAVEFTVVLNTPGGKMLLKGKGKVVRAESGAATTGVGIEITNTILELAPESDVKSAPPKRKLRRAKKRPA